MINPVVSTAINAATWTAIKIPFNPLSNISNCNPVSVYTDDASAWYMSASDGGTQAPIAAAKYLNIECVKADADGTILWAKASGQLTPNLIVLLGVEYKKR